MLLIPQLPQGTSFRGGTRPRGRTGKATLCYNTINESPVDMDDAKHIFTQQQHSRAGMYTHSLRNISGVLYDTTRVTGACPVTTDLIMRVNVS